MTHRTQGNIYVNQFIKGYDKGCSGQPDEEIHGARCGRVPRAGASVPMELGCITPPAPSMDVFSNLEALQTPFSWDFMEASSQRCDQLLTPFPTPLPSLEDAGEWR